MAPRRGRAIAHLRGVPTPLAALLGAVVLLGLAWALVVPPAEAPDEPVHLAYVQILAETGHRPGLDLGRVGGNVFSSEQRLARKVSNYEAPISQPTVRPEWRRSAFERWRERARDLPDSARRDGGSANAAAGNPPLYYAWEAIAYRAASGGDLFTRWYAMRVWSMLALGVAVVATWLLIGELTGRDRLAQFAAAGFVGLQPGATAISAAINPDGAMIAAWAMVLWLGVRLLRREPSVGGVVALLAATLAALLIKATSFGLLPAVALVLVIAGRRALHGRRPRVIELTALGVLAGGAIAAVIATGATNRLSGGLNGAGHPSLRGFLSYLWQAYLPNLPFQTQVKNLAPFWGYDVWVKSGWGNFGWAEQLLPAAVHAVIGVACLALLGAGALAVWRGRFPVDGAVLAFLGVVAVALVLGLHWGEYRQFLDTHLSLLQGRYLLPLLPIGGLALAAALTNLRLRHRPLAIGVLIVAMFALQLFSLGIVVGRFYA